MARNFGIRDEVDNATEDIWLFQIDLTDRKLGGDLRIIGSVLPLDKAEIVPVRTVEVENQPRYKALFALCLCAGLLGVGAIALLASTSNSATEAIAYSAKKKGTLRPPGSY